jgi:small ligand-binding sensory domain FIST
MQLQGKDRMTTAATGFATAGEAHPELAAEAVAQALARCGTDMAQGILLFLTPHYARHAQAAVGAASRAGRCLQVTGCTTPGVLTESAWSLEQPAAAALVLAGGIALGAPQAEGEQPRLSLAMPNSLERGWLGVPRPRYGTLATGNEDHAVGAVWGHGKWLLEGRVEAELHGGRVEIAVSRGMRAISGVLEIGESDGYEVLQIDEQPALNTLLRQLPTELRQERLPLALLFAAVIEEDMPLERAVGEGRYALVPIVAANGEDGTLTLGAPLDPGTRMFWALRHPQTAETEFGRGIDTIALRNGTPPEFAMLFSCIGRGPYFFGGEDRDLAQLTEHFPGMPVIGCYCGGEIAPLPGGNAVTSYSAIAALAYPATADVQS